MLLACLTWMLTLAFLFHLSHDGYTLATTNSTSPVYHSPSSSPARHQRDAHHLLSALPPYTVPDPPHNMWRATVNFQHSSDHHAPTDPSHTWGAVVASPSYCLLSSPVGVVHHCPSRERRECFSPSSNHQSPNIGTFHEF